MTSSHIIIATIASAFAASMTDWFFSGILFHDKYLAYPEIWRRTPGGSGAGEGRAVGLSMLLGAVTCAAFVVTCSAFQVRGYDSAIELAIAIWIMAPLVILITNALFVKMHPLTVVAHSLGWLARLVLTAVVVGWLS